MIDLNSDTLLVRLIVATVISAVVATVWPQIDLAVSGWFYEADTGFWIADIWLVKVIREVIYGLMALILIVSIALTFAGLAGFRPIGIPTRLWAFIATYFILGPLFVANVVLKNNWGRARPANIEDFGGPSAFTPALRWANECVTNCSFVSGEGSGATVLAIAILLIAPYLLKNTRPRRRRVIIAWALAVPAVAIVLRVAMGRHFLSDTVFAVLFMLIIGALLHRVFLGKASQLPKTLL